MPLSEREKKRFSDILNSEEFVASFNAEQEGRKNDPYQYSSLKYWLKLDSWTLEEGIYLLAGLDPKTVDMHLLETDISKFDDALPLDKHPSFQIDPTEVCDRNEFPGDDDAYQCYLEAYESKKATLGKHQRIVSTLHHILSRSINGLGDPVIKSGFSSSYRPVQFLEWAKSISYKVPWIDSKIAQEALTSASKILCKEIEKPLGTRERDTLLTIIAVLCREAKLDHIKHAKTAGLIQSMAAGMGVSIGESTIEGHLKRIPDALGNRMK